MKWMYHLAGKILVLFLLLLTLGLSIAGTIGIYFFNGIGFYHESYDGLKDEYFSAITSYYIDEVNGYFNEYYLLKNNNAKGLYQNVISVDRTNFRYGIYIVAEDGTLYLVDTNYKGEEVSYTYEHSDASLYSEQTLMSFIEKQNQNNNVTLTKEIRIVGYTLRSLSVKDQYVTDTRIWLLNNFYQYRYILVFITTICYIISAILFFVLSSIAGHTPDQKEIKLRTYEKVPLDVLLVINGFAFVYIINILVNFYIDMGYFLYSFAATMVFLLFSLENWMSICVRAKAGILLSTTFIYKLGNLVWKICCHIGRRINYAFINLPIYWVAFASMAVWTFFDLLRKIMIGIIFKDPYIIDSFFEAWERLAIIILVCIITVQIHMLIKHSENMVKGDFKNSLKTTFLFGPLKKIGRNLNNINKGMDIALKEQMRSEHMRTELITNVSHDIKTPLTSIVNYVDLLKQKEYDDEQVLEYLEVLDRQSNRLKKLVEDIVESSKASSGNIKMELEPTNLDIMLSQVIAEYDSRLKANQLELVYRPLDEDTYVLADGHYLWRVFDNLFGNLCKYAQQGTRVYVSVLDNDAEVTIVLKNVSRYELNISTDELMERFVRGDSSRNAEGSGLGISITRSLVELQLGKFSMEIDGDLFKTYVRLKKVEPQE